MKRRRPHALSRSSASSREGRTDALGGKDDGRSSKDPAGSPSRPCTAGENTYGGMKAQDVKRLKRAREGRTPSGTPGRRQGGWKVLAFKEISKGKC